MTKDTEALREAIEGIDDDYMTSEKHHPGYVLIPTVKFEQMVAAAKRAKEIVPPYYVNWHHAANKALATPASDVAPVGEKPVLIEWITELARRDILRTQTDFIGRMHQTICEFESICDDNPDGELDEAARDDAGEALAGLAGLALAQLAMVSDPADPIKQLAHPPLAQSVDPVAVLQYDKVTCGNENEMPKVISCNWLPDGEYPVFLAAPVPVEPVAGGEALREALRRARDYLLEVGNDYPGSSCQKWCAEKATEIWNTLKPWEHCPSTHCERAQQCRSPNECSANTAALKGPAA